MIRFMAIFSLLTGMIVLISSLLLSKYQRLKESILLRIIGATRSQIIKINATEYAFLGFLSAGTGFFIAVLSSFLVTKFQLKLDYQIAWWPVVGIIVGIVTITVVIGMLNSQDIVSSPPLEVLRKEGS
ncbi:MAG: FtsX-like permease family protein [Saprospiraceae bacterium]|nr:FtsX-like permease family protein [Saprospiraceae bacterium]